MHSSAELTDCHGHAIMMDPDCKIGGCPAEKLRRLLNEGLLRCMLNLDPPEQAEGATSSMAQSDEQRSAQRLFVRAAATDDQQAEACLAGAERLLILRKSARPASLRHVAEGVICFDTLRSKLTSAATLLQAAQSAQLWKKVCLRTLCQHLPAAARSLASREVNKTSKYQQACLILMWCQHFKAQCTIQARIGLQAVQLSLQTSIPATSCHSLATSLVQIRRSLWEEIVLLQPFL